MANRLPPIHGFAPFVPASKLVETTGRALTDIKEHDGLTWADVGEALGKSDDQAAKYGSGFASMDFVTFLRACQRWNGRFSVAATMMGLAISPTVPRGGASDARQGMLHLTLLLAELQKAMLDDTLSDEEVEAMDLLIEQASQFLEAMRKRAAAAKAARPDKQGV